MVRDGGVAAQSHHSHLERLGQTGTGGANVAEPMRRMGIQEMPVSLMLITSRSKVCPAVPVILTSVMVFAGSQAGSQVHLLITSNHLPCVLPASCPQTKTFSG